MRTLFVDDSERILDAAQAFGIRYCLGVQNPDSSMPSQTFSSHPSISDYHRLIPALKRRHTEAQ